MVLRVAVAHPGPQHAGQTALGLQKAGLLAWYATPLHNVAGPRLEGLDERLVRRRPVLDFAERAAIRLLPRRRRAQARFRADERFGERLVRLYEREPVDVLWASPACLAAFRALKPRGVVCVLDQSTGHRAALDEVALAEFARHPEFFAAPPARAGAAAVARTREAVELADLVVVGSEFAARTYADYGADPARLRVLPYGYDERLFPPDRPVRPPLEGRPAEFVYVGRVSPLKGAAHLLEAFARIDPARARLTLVGELDLPARVFARYAGHVTHLGRVPHAEVPALMRRADAFVFPSLFEGGGIVLYEAAAAALGIIQTDACGDGVRDDNGLVVPAGSADAIVAAVEAALEPGRLQQWSDASWAVHADRSWARYRAAVAATVRALTRS